MISTNNEKNVQTARQTSSKILIAANLHIQTKTVTIPETHLPNIYTWPYVK